ncbi:hypothetical protein RJ639_007117 [Escallonia herrerae]|uniref:Uncharacterized protein n=1 Tax=Escallonia herrerae TaxID=1293975 RepID=A0AA88W0X0_9ASTE|nr:hypothetical protein RJ639_007117 [Escallonia herrerae]
MYTNAYEQTNKPSPPPSSSSSQVNQYIGSFISLTSKSDIRYEGFLYYLNPQDSTIGLQNEWALAILPVRSAASMWPATKAGDLDNLSDSDGSLAKCEGTLVAKGFKQTTQWGKDHRDNRIGQADSNFECFGKNESNPNPWLSTNYKPTQMMKPWSNFGKNSCNLEHQKHLRFMRASVDDQEVRSYGTEGRRKGGVQVPPSDQLYEHILFRGGDIKMVFGWKEEEVAEEGLGVVKVVAVAVDLFEVDEGGGEGREEVGVVVVGGDWVGAEETGENLERSEKLKKEQGKNPMDRREYYDLQVKLSPAAQTEDSMHNDPAIIQSNCALGPLSSSKSASTSGGSLTEYSRYQETPALISRPYPGKSPPFPSGGPTVQNISETSFTLPNFWQEHDGRSRSIPYAPHHTPPFLPTSATATQFPGRMENYLQAPSTQMSTSIGLSTSNGVTPVSSVFPSNHVYMSGRPSLTPEQYPTPLSDMPSSLSANVPLPSHPKVLTPDRLNMTSFPTSRQDMSTIVGELGSDHITALPVQASANFASSSSLPKLDRLLQPRLSAVSHTQKTYLGPQGSYALSSAASNSSSQNNTRSMQAPPLPLPPPTQQPRYPLQFTEEFDFVAMNEKFKKDEVWGILGKANQRDRTEGLKEDALGQSLGDNVGNGLGPKVNTKPAYNKDEFFDTISCHSLASGTANGQNRFPERAKLGSELELDGCDA